MKRSAVYDRPRKPRRTGARRKKDGCCSPSTDRVGGKQPVTPYLCRTQQGESNRSGGGGDGLALHAASGRSGGPDPTVALCGTSGRPARDSVWLRREGALPLIALAVYPPRAPHGGLHAPQLSLPPFSPRPFPS